MARKKPRGGYDLAASIAPSTKSPARWSEGKPTGPMPKLPKGWVPGKGIVRPAGGDGRPGTTPPSADRKPGRRQRRDGPGGVGTVSRRWVATLREKTRLEWVAVGLTLILVGRIAQLTLSAGPDTYDVSGEVHLDTPADRATPVRTAIVIESEDGDEEKVSQGWAFLPPPGTRHERRPAAKEAVDILPLVSIEDPDREGLLRQAAFGSESERAAAMDEFRKQDREALPYVMAVYETGVEHEKAEPALMEAVVEILSHISDPAAASAVRGAIRSPIPEIRHQVLVKLQDWRDPKAIELTIQGLGDSSPVVRVRADRILRDAGRDVRPALIEALRLTRSDDAERARALISLVAEEADEGALRAMQDLLGHESPEIRREALRTLGGWGRPSYGLRPETISAVRQRLGDPEPLVRGQAALTLLSYGDVDSLEELIEMLRDPDDGVRDAARRALAGITRSEDVGGSYLAWRKYLEDRHVD